MDNITFDSMKEAASADAGMEIRREQSSMRVSVKEAASELHIGMLTLKCLMQEGRLPIGYALKRPGKTKYGYYIYRRLLDEHKKQLGIV